MNIDPMLQQTQQPYEYAGDNPVNQTDASGNWVLGFCGGFFLAILGAREASGCLVRTFWEPSGRDDIGFTGTWGSGWGGFGAGLNLGILISNADYIQDLGGPFRAINISYLRLGASLFTGIGPYTHHRVVGAELQLCYCASLAKYGAGWVTTHTNTRVIRDWWQADPLRLIWNALVNAVGFFTFTPYWTTLISFIARL